MPMKLAGKPNPSNPPRRVVMTHVPTPALEQAIKGMQAGQYDEYDSVEAIRADIETEKKKRPR